MATPLTLPQIVIVDLGSQYSQVIRRTLQELNFRSVILSPEKAEALLASHRPKGIIWSGGAACVGDADAPIPPKRYLGDVPLLGICLGMQYLAAWEGGKLAKVTQHKEYGQRMAKITAPDSPLLTGVTDSAVLCSHGDSVTAVPPNYRVTAVTADCPVLAMEATDGRPIYAVQFHPEVSTTTQGKTILANFVQTICAATPDWQAANLADDLRGAVQPQLTASSKVLLLYSGGIDSTVIASLLSPLLGDRLIGLSIDAGQLRQDELTTIRANAKAAGLANHHIIDVSNQLLAGLRADLEQAAERITKDWSGKGADLADRMIEALEKHVHAEVKRSVFKKLYADTTLAFAKKHGCTHWVQGTLAPDLIESGGVGGASTIKSHHNVGLDIGLPAIAPLAQMFKHEVRALGRSLGLPASATERMPFPGPGLLVRIFGMPVTRERLDLLRQADASAEQTIRAAGFYDQFEQLVVALCGAKTVGVKGDERDYGYAVVVRGIRTDDFMTARPVSFPPELRVELTQKLTQLRSITRVWFDETPKPPATIEME